MSSVAERLVPRRTATAQSDSLARFVGEAIGGDDRDSAAKPDRAAAVSLSILDEADRDRQLVFQRFAARCPTPLGGWRGNVFTCCRNCARIAGSLVWSTCFHTPPLGIAESTKRAQAFPIRKR
jgi:hypothetical protein